MTERAFATFCVLAIWCTASLALGLWANLRVTEADRHYRTARAEACRTIEDQSLRTLCLVKP